MEIEPPSDSNDPSQLGSALRQLVDAHLHAATVDVDTMQELTLAVQAEYGGLADAIRNVSEFLGPDSKLQHETLAKVLLEVDDVDAATAALEEAAAALELRIQGLERRAEEE